MDIVDFHRPLNAEVSATLKKTKICVKSQGDCPHSSEILLHCQKFNFVQRLDTYGGQKTPFTREVYVRFDLKTEILKQAFLKTFYLSTRMSRAKRFKAFQNAACSNR